MSSLQAEDHETGVFNWSYQAGDHKTDATSTALTTDRAVEIRSIELNPKTSVQGEEPPPAPKPKGNTLTSKIWSAARSIQQIGRKLMSSICSATPKTSVQGEEPPPAPKPKGNTLTSKIWSAARSIHQIGRKLMSSIWSAAKYMVGKISKVFRGRRPEIVQSQSQALEPRATRASMAGKLWFSKLLSAVKWLFTWGKNTQLFQAVPAVEIEGFTSRREWLFHMTDESAAEKIISSKCMVPGKKGMFGPAIYFCKSEEDCLNKAQRRGVTLRCKVCLGKSLICKKKNININMEWVRRYGTQLIIKHNIDYS